MKLLLAGALAMGFGIAGLFFLRFWRKTRDRLFALFALSFFVMALNRVMLALLAAAGAPGADRDPWADRLYWVRLIAFTLILVAILDKNRARSPRHRARSNEGARRIRRSMAVVHPPRSRRPQAGDRSSLGRLRLLC